MKYQRLFADLGSAVGQTVDTPNVVMLRSISNRVLFVPKDYNENVTLTKDEDFIKISTGPEPNEIWYTSSDGSLISGYANGEGSSSRISIYSDEYGIMYADEPIIYLNNNSAMGGGLFTNDMLTSLVFPEGLITIDYRVAKYNLSLVSITIPTTVKTINEDSFSYTGLTTIKYNGTKEQWSLIYIYSAFTDIPTNSVICKDGIISIYTTPTDEIGYISSDGSVITPTNADAFGVSISSNVNENGYGTIKFAGDVVKIGDNAFNGCSELYTIYIPKSVTYIGSSVFSGVNLHKIIYDMTCADWNKIEKSSDWADGITSTCVVECIDGNININ